MKPFSRDKLKRDEHKNLKACFKPAKGVKEAVFEIDDLWSRVESLQKRALIGRWIFAEKTRTDMEEWVKEFWSPMVGYNPKFGRMMNGWFSVHFMHEDDCKKVMARAWVRGHSFMKLMPWYLGFNPVMDAPRNKSVWVKLLGLPLEFWTMSALRAIGNSIGKTLFIDPNIIGTSDKRIAWILVEVCFGGGLPGDVDLVWGEQRHKQRLDYWGVPFHCLMCHQTGHLLNRCPL